MSFIVASRRGSVLNVMVIVIILIIIFLAAIEVLRWLKKLARHR